MTKRINMLPKIEMGNIPNIILLGNGINRVDISDSKESWEEFLKDIATDDFKGRLGDIEDMPYPLRPIVVTGDNIKAQLEKKAIKLLPHGLSKEYSEFIRGFTDLPFDAILTTNYTYELEQSILPGFSCDFKRPSKYRKTSIDGNKLNEQLGIFKYFSLPVNDKNSMVWHIHGEAARPNSMVLGHYYYGNLLSVIQQRIPHILSSLSISTKKDISFQPKSWIDYFMLGNVYIVGFGMEFSEMDIWWMVNCKRRRFYDFGKIVYYEPKCNETQNRSKCELARAYKIEMPDLEFDGNYMKYYDCVIRDIKKRIIH